MKIWISGISGTLGQVVCRMLLARGHSITGYSRDEQKQALLSPLDVVLYLGDIRDGRRVEESTRGMDLILHFASHKMVDLLESNPEEAVSSIVLGTQNILYAQRVNRIPRVAFTSTDKAVYPVNVYGSCKMTAEKLVLRNPNNIVCRYGNVLGSRGSVLPMFVKSLREHQLVKVTSVRMTRFWTTVEKAASFVISCALEADGGVHIPPLSSSSVLSLAEAVAKHIGVDAYSIEETGIRPGEKLHECLMTHEEAKDGRAVYSDDEEMPEEELQALVAEALRGT